MEGQTRVAVAGISDGPSLGPQFRAAAVTNHYECQGLKQRIQLWRSKVQKEGHWTTIKALVGLCSFWRRQGRRAPRLPASGSSCLPWRPAPPPPSNPARQQAPSLLLELCVHYLISSLDPTLLLPSSKDPYDSNRPPVPSRGYLKLR